MNLRRALIVIISLLALCLSTVSAQELEGETLTVNLGETGIATLDPIFAGDIASQQVLHSLYVGLTRMDPLTNTLQPGLAGSWSRTFLPDETILYRFAIEDDIPWVRYDPEEEQVVQVLDEDGDPRMVTISDVAYGILRALDPDLATEYSYTIGEQIDNGVNYINGEVSSEDVGILININDIGITTSGLNADIPQLMSQIQVLPQPSWLIEEFGMDWARPDNFVSYGPYALRSFNDTTVSLIVNPFWQGTEFVPPPTIDNIIFTFLNSEDALLSYDAGEIDLIVNPAIADFTAIEETYGDELSQSPRDVVHFYGLNLRETFPTASPQFRQALAQSLDRDALASIIIGNGNAPATRYLPPTVRDAPADSASVYAFNSGQAQSNLAAAGLDETRVDLIYRNTGYFGQLATAIAEQWQSQLGIDVTLLPQDFDGSFANREFSAVWVGEAFSDTALSQSYLTPFVTDGDFSEATMFSSEDFDAAYDAIYGEAPAEDPLGFLQAMETTLLEDVIIIPISWTADTELTKPNVERTPTINGIRAFETWFVNN